ncbi:MAG: EAL and HDOD domain-containing protein [Phycisphaeraceae bacterium]
MSVSALPTPPASPGKDEIFVARQPVFDLDRQVHGYELLFRGSRENHFTGGDGDTASLHTLNNALHLMGLPSLTGQKPAFVNFTRKLILDGVHTLLPSDLAVIEILEDVPHDREVLDACAAMKDEGYRLAMDDCSAVTPDSPLWEMVDIVKVDFMKCTPNERYELADRCRARGVAALAEKVETEQHFQEARSAGYSYFQGYFFCRPEIRSGRDLRASQVPYLRFLQQINEEQIDYDALEQTVKQDASLSYKLLRYLNSAALGLAQRVTSIHHALVLLGEEPLRKWGSLVALTGLADQCPSELMVTCLSRGQFCERVGALAGRDDAGGALFLLGLLSGLNAVLGRPMREVLQDVPVDADIRDALLGRQTPTGALYSLARACERGNWERVGEIADRLGVPLWRVAEAHREALVWADAVSGETRRDS